MQAFWGGQVRGKGKQGHKYGASRRICVEEMNYTEEGDKTGVLFWDKFIKSLVC